MPTKGAHRALLLFHHIRSSKKIRDIHAWSEELDLQGLLHIGYPGVLLVCDRRHADTSLVPEYVRRIKRLPWQSCELRSMERVEHPASLDALHSTLSTYSTPTSLLRRSGLVQLDRLKDITAFTREADRICIGMGLPPAWEALYRNAMLAS